MRAASIWGYAVVLSIAMTIYGHAKDPLSATAEYYFSRQDYEQALQLWLQVLKRHPKNIDALLRIGELRLHFEGREAFRATLYDFIEKYRKQLSDDAYARIRDRWQQLQSIFLTDEGQERYLQAVARLKREDFQGARKLLEQAHGLEKGNIKILLEKAKCEKALGVMKDFYETLKVAHKSDPFHSDVLNELVEVQIYFKDYGQLLAIYKNDKQTQSQRQTIGLGVALMKVGKSDEALRVLERVVRANTKRALPPIVFFAVGSLLSKERNRRGESLTYLDRFLKEANRQGKVKAWDPYQTEEYIKPAKLLMEQLRATS